MIGRVLRALGVDTMSELDAGLRDLREFILEVGGDRIGAPCRDGDRVYVPLVARDGERYVLRIEPTVYLLEPPGCTFVDEQYQPSVEAWPYPSPGGPFRSPSFICTPPTAEFYAHHPERTYRSGEGSLVHTVATVFAALHAPEYVGRWSRSGRR